MHLTKGPLVRGLRGTLTKEVLSKRDSVKSCMRQKGNSIRHYLPFATPCIDLVVGNIAVRYADLKIHRAISDLKC